VLYCISSGVRHGRDDFDRVDGHDLESSNGLHKDQRGLRPLPPKFSVKIEGGKTFEQAFNDFRSRQAIDSIKWPPTFAFIDPFGWTGAPFSIVESILKRASCEVFVTFMYEEINRFLDHKDQVSNFNSLFGGEAWQACRSLQSPNERRRCLHSSHPSRLTGRCHDATDERAGSGPPTMRFAVERREAQRPGGGPRKPAIAGRARLGAGFATPS
jgi:hypothetical protein